MSRSNFRIIKSIRSGVWHMEPTFAASMMPLVNKFLNGDLQSFWDDMDEQAQDDKVSPEAERYLNTFKSAAEPYVSERQTWYYSSFPVKEGNVLFMPIIGAISQEDYCGTPGTLTLSGWYKKAASDPEIDAIVEIRSSGGGEAFGTRSLAELKATIQKPIVGFVRDVDCSASAYIGATDDYTFVASKDAILGSVGTMMTFRNFSKYYEKMGLVTKDLYPATSSKKNEDHRRAMEGDYKGYEEGLLADLDDNFMSFMKDHRPNLSEEALKGGHFTTMKAIKHGFADAIGTVEDATAKALSLTTDYSNQNKSTIMSKVTMEVPSFAASVVKALGGSVVETEKPAQEAAPAVDDTPAEEEAPASPSAEATVENELPATASEVEASNPLQVQIDQLTKENEQYKAALVELGKENPAAARTAARQEGADPQPKNPNTEEEIEFTTSANFGHVPAKAEK